MVIVGGGLRRLRARVLVLRCGVKGCGMGKGVVES